MRYKGAPYKVLVAPCESVTSPILPLFSIGFLVLVQWFLWKWSYQFFLFLLWKGICLMYKILLECWFHLQYGDVFTFILLGHWVTIALGVKGNNFHSLWKVDYHENEGCIQGQWDQEVSQWLCLISAAAYDNPHLWRGYHFWYSKQEFHGEGLHQGWPYNWQLQKHMQVWSRMRLTNFWHMTLLSLFFSPTIPANGGRMQGPNLKLEVNKVEPQQVVKQCIEY